MIRTIEAVVDAQGRLNLSEFVRLPAPRRALVTILEDEAAIPMHESALLSEAARRIGVGRKRTQHGLTFSRLNSSCSISILGFIAV